MRRLGGKLLASALAAFAALELVSAHADLHATAPESAMFSPPPLAELVDRSGARRFYAYDYLLLPGRAESLLGRGYPFETIPPPPGWEPRHFAFAARQLYLPPPAAALFGIPGSYDADMRALYPRDLNDLTFFVRQLDGTPALARLLSMGGVATVASLHSAGLQGLTPKATLQSLFPEPIHVWSVPGEPRRAWLVGCVRDADAAAAFQALVAPAFDPAREAIVAEPPAGLPSCPGEPGSPGDARIASFTSDRVGFEVHALRPSLLVLADAWDPGWRASVDGREAAVVRTNVAFRGVAVPPGRHQVEMVYRPRAAALGLAASLACAIVCAALAVHARRPASARRAG